MNIDLLTYKLQYAEYAIDDVPAAGPAATSQAHVGPAPPVAEDPKKDVEVTPRAPPAVQQPEGVVSEEKVEFRDENGNLLDEEQVKAMEGKVSFSTRYETRTRLVDEAGNEVYEGVVVEEGGKAEPQVVEHEAVENAGTIAEGSNPDTQDALGENEANTVPPMAAVKEDLKKEASVQESIAAVPEPESEVGGERTAREEL